MLLLIGVGAIGGAFVFIMIGVLKLPILERFAPTRHLVEVSRTAGRRRDPGRSAATVGTLSFAIHMLTIASVWCLAQSVSASASFALLLFIIPPVLLIATIPVSIAGWACAKAA